MTTVSPAHPPNLVERIWRRDPTVFVGDGAPDSAYASIRTRLGWLDAPEAMAGPADAVTRFADQVRADGLTRVVLLGMGGSSLCAEVLRDVPDPDRRIDGCALTVLDTTDERAIRAVTDRLDPRQTLVVVASKSGTTIEISALEAHLWHTMSRALGASAGRHFAAITDPDTALVTLAAERGYRHTFVNPPDIGGRYSALSLFGLVPAALAGCDTRALLASARRMAAACRVEGDANPGLALGRFMAEQARAGRDKLTLLASPDLAVFGAWVEQLVAESTGKQGDGVLPVVGEPFGAAASYGPDRAFVALTTDPGDGTTRLARELKAAGHPVLTIAASPAELGAEFFRWEFATAAAGALLGLNPFDEPNVREAKTRTLAQLDARRTTGAFRLEPPLVAGDGYARREFRPAAAPTSARRRYVALLDFLPADPARAALAATLRAAVRHRLGLAVTYGVGPRYLHSTGQYHKGGPATGIFLLFTAADATETPVPGADYSFSALKYAQALGDFDALVANNRHVIHYHLSDPAADFSATLERLIDQLVPGDSSV